MIHRFTAYFLYGLLWFLTIPPLRIMFMTEKPAAWILHRIIGYRLKVIQDNLTKSFPELSGEDLAHMTKDYYRWMVRVFMESVKSMHWSGNKLGQRIHVVNPEILDEMAENGKDLILLAGHTGNWEWIPGAVCPFNFDLLGIYKPQSGKTANFLTYLIRKRKGVEPVPMKSTVRALTRTDSEKTRSRVLLLIADQIPAAGDIHYWHTFLNQETAWFTGGEKLAVKYDLAVLFLRLRETGRGRYQAELIPLRYPGEETPKNEITSRYIKALEDTIRSNPAYWLWSHRRWKHQRNTISL